MFITNNVSAGVPPRLPLSSRWGRELFLVGWGWCGGTPLWWMLGHRVRKAADHTSEILIRTPGRGEAPTLAALLGLPSTSQAKLQEKKPTTHTSQKSLPLSRNRYCNYLGGTDASAAECSPLPRTVKAVDVPRVSVCAIMRVCSHAGDRDCSASSLFKPQMQKGRNTQF